MDNISFKLLITKSLIHHHTHNHIIISITNETHSTTNTQNAHLEE